MEPSVTGGGEREELRSFLRGDPETCERVERWVREIIHFRYSRIPADDRDDVVQETVASVWRAVSRPAFELRTSLRAVVRRIAIARCIDRHRKLRLTEPLDESLPDPRPDPGEALLTHDRQDRVRWALQSLGANCREILRLYFLERMTYGAIAERLGRAESTMRVRMFHCMKRIRNLLASVGEA